MKTPMKKMNPKRNVFSVIVVTFATLASAGLISSAFAKNYVNWANEYYFEIPDGWRQIERYNVEEFLRLHGKDPASVPYDAFFCPSDAEPFWSRAYLFVSTEKSQNSFAQADSLLKGMAAEFDKMVKSEDTLGPITRVKSRKPKLDRKAKTITQVSNLNVQGVDQVLELVMKFQRTGITTFYFYSRADMYQKYQPQFARVISSFSDENLADAGESAAVSIVNVSEPDTAAATVAETNEAEPKQDDSDGLSFGNGVYGAIAAILIIIFVIAARARKPGGG